jgi:hypothetical protein
MAKRRKKRQRSFGELESSDWTRGPDEMSFSDEDRAKQDTVTGWALGIGAVLLAVVVLKKSS